jgi:hypothetical protein
MDRDTISHELATLGMQAGRDGLFIDGKREVGAVVTDAGVFAGWLDAAWDGPATPVWALCAVMHLPCPHAGSLRAVFGTLRKKRAKALRACQFCGEQLTPGHMHRIDERDVCHGCAETELHVVH